MKRILSRAVLFLGISMSIAAQTIETVEPLELVVIEYCNVSLIEEKALAFLGTEKTLDSWHELIEVVFNEITTKVVKTEDLVRLKETIKGLHYLLLITTPEPHDVKAYGNHELFHYHRATRLLGLNKTNIAVWATINTFWFFTALNHRLSGYNFFARMPSWCVVGNLLHSVAEIILQHKRFSAMQARTYIKAYDTLRVLMHFIDARMLERGLKPEGVLS